MMDIADQLANGLLGDESQQIQNGKLDGGQRRAEGDAVEPEIEAVGTTMSADFSVRAAFLRLDRLMGDMFK